jgi:hypothetical protein
MLIYLARGQFIKSVHGFSDSISLDPFGYSWRNIDHSNEGWLWPSNIHQTKVDSPNKHAWLIANKISQRNGRDISHFEAPTMRKVPKGGISSSMPWRWRNGWVNGCQYVLLSRQKSRWILYVCQHIYIYIYIYSFIFTYLLSIHQSNYLYIWCTQQSMTTYDHIWLYIIMYVYIYIIIISLYKHKYV